MSISAIQEFNKRQQQWYASRTGIVVDIQRIGKNTDLIAVKEEPSLQELQPGVWLKKSVIEFPDQNFSNVYDFYWNPKVATVLPEVQSSNKPYTLLETMEHSKEMLAVINGGFFFLTDIADSKPIDLVYNLCIRDRKLFGLPSWDQPIVYVEKKTLCTKEPKAQGMLRIAKRKIRWVGARSESCKARMGDAVLYNSKCSEIIKVRDPKTNLQIGILDNDTVRTPQKEGVIDIVVAQNPIGQLVIKDIREGGNTEFFKGLFVLQLQGSKQEFKKGEKVTPLTLDGIPLKNITSGITIGRRLEDSFFLDPIRSDRRDARSLIAKDTRGYIHFIVIDGSKYIPGFHGVSANDIKKYYARNRFEWAYFLDGGGSSRLIVKNDGILEILANQFAFRKTADGHVLWDWKKGRAVTSSISLRVVKAKSL